MNNRLAHLRETVIQLDRDIKRHSQAAVEAAIEAGAALLEAKSLSGHGQWRDWLAATCLSERTAQRYMRLARSGLKPATVADLGGIRAADLFLSWHKSEGLEKWAPDDAASSIVNGRLFRDAEAANPGILERTLLGLIADGVEPTREAMVMAAVAA